MKAIRALASAALAGLVLVALAIPAAAAPETRSSTDRPPAAISSGGIEES